MTRRMPSAIFVNRYAPPLSLGLISRVTSTAAPVPHVRPGGHRLLDRHPNQWSCVGAETFRRPSGLGNLDGPPAGIRFVRVGSPADTFVEAVERGHFVGCQFETEDVEVLGNARRRGGLGDSLPALLDLPAQHDLSGSLAVGGGDGPDRAVAQRARAVLTPVEGDAPDRRPGL